MIQDLRYLLIFLVAGCIFGCQNPEEALIQHVGEANLSWMVYRNLSLSVYYEGTFEKEVPYHRLYINISKRF